MALTRIKNLIDVGNTGTKIASGTNAQRGSTTGQLRFNTDTGLAEYYTGTAFKSIDAPPTISSLDVTEVDSQAGGNQTIIITGSGFNSGATVTFIGNSGTDFNASTVTRNSDTQITAVAPKSSFLNAQEPYGVKVTNVSGLSATLASQINVDTAPSFTLASGSLGTLISSNRAGSNLTTITATDPDGDTVTFSHTAGTIPTGLTFNSNGTFSGTANAEVSDTTYTFTITATANSKTANRQYTITVQAPQAYAYSYTGSNQTFTVPNSVTSFQIHMWGAGGGGGSSRSGSNTVGGNGGAGGYVSATISGYTAGQTFSLLVGGAQQTSQGIAIANYGGGGGGSGNGTQGFGGHGGGRSELSIGGGSNTPSGTRILVAGGGGGGGASYQNTENGNKNGGNGGYPNGGSGFGSGTVPTGGTQSAGGSAGSGASYQSGAFGSSPIAGYSGIGGYARAGNQSTDIGYGRPGGGGGGFFGGGGGEGGGQNQNSQGGGAGSSYYNSSYVSNFTHETGSHTTAPQSGNSYYATGIAVGGTGDETSNRANILGGNGRIVLVY